MKKLIQVVVLGCSVLSLKGAVLNFSNPSSISLNEPSTPHTAPTVAAPYPSTISVSGVTEPVATIRVILNNVNQTRMDDLEMLLVSPTGVKFVILSDAGGSVAPAGMNITLGDSAASQVPDAGPIATGTYQPTCVDSAVNIDTAFPAPAPAGPYNKPAPRGTATFASAFAGINVNGTWSLYVVDDTVNTPQTASITGGWTVEITTNPSAVATVTTLNSTPNPSFTTAPNNAVTFTATVTKQSDGTPVTQGTVTFREGATTLAANVALNGSGQASFNTSTLSEGSHTITASYNGSAGFLTSSGNVVQQVSVHPATVQFNNTATTQLTTNSGPNPPPGQSPNQSGLTTGFGQYTIGLYIAPQGTTDPNAFTLMQPTTLSQSGLGNGRFNGNPLPNYFVISNNTGQTIAFQVRAWHTFAGATYEAALAHSDPARYLGVSTIGTVTPVMSGTAPALFGTGAGQVGGFVLAPGGLRVVSVGFHVDVAFTTVNGARYRIERTDNTTTWTPVAGATNVLGTGNIVSITDSNASCHPMRAYRAVRLP